MPRSTQPLPRAQAEDLFGSSGSSRRGVTPPPLPGGTALLSHFNNAGGRPSAGGASNARTKKTDGPEPEADASIIGSLVAVFFSVVGSLFNMIFSGDAGRPVHRAKRIVQTGLFALGLLMIVGGAVYYVVSPASADADEQPEFTQEASPVKEAASAEAASSLRGGAPASKAGGDLRAMQAEIASLREYLDRHDKMIKYIMTRFVEKDAGTAHAMDNHGGSSDGAQVGVAVAEAKPAEADATSAIDVDALAGQKAGDRAGKRRGRVEDVSPQQAFDAMFGTGGVAGGDFAVPGAAMGGIGAVHTESR